MLTRAKSLMRWMCLVRWMSLMMLCTKGMWRLRANRKVIKGDGVGPCLPYWHLFRVAVLLVYGGSAVAIMG
jgi:hypothetical protein